jgi:hypothetical protein
LGLSGLLRLPELLELPLQTVYLPLGLPALTLPLPLLALHPGLLLLVLQTPCALPLELLRQSPVLLAQLLELPVQSPDVLLKLQALLSLPLRLFFQGSMFFAQELQDAGLLLAKVLHTLLGNLHVPPRILQGESGCGEGRGAERDKRAGADEAQRLDHVPCLPQTTCRTPYSPALIAASIVV